MLWWASSTAPPTPEPHRGDRMKIARKRILRMYDAIALLPRIDDVKTAYALAKTKRVALEPTVQALREMQTPAAAYLDYDRQRLDLCREYAETDERGSPKVRGDQYVLRAADRAAFDAQMAALMER